jgi:hypothetical protein
MISARHNAQLATGIASSGFISWSAIGIVLLLIAACLPFEPL